MTVPEITQKLDIVYQGDGATTQFAYPFYFYEDSELLVFLRESNGYDRPLTLGTDYTVTGAGSENGVVTYNVAPASNEAAVIDRAVKVVQNITLDDNERNPAKTTEGQLDRQTRMHQDRQNLQDRNYTSPRGEVGGHIQTINDPGRILISDGFGNFVDGGVAGGGGGSSTFVGLIDTPNNYADAGGKIVSVKGDETGLEFVSAGSGSDLIGILDNWIINGAFSVNQRGGTKTPGVGVYGFDRWKGHANGLEQVVESLPAGEWTLHWQGGGSGTFGGTTAESPIKATVTAGNTSVIVPSTADRVSLLFGDWTAISDPFFPRLPGRELALCYRYYQQRKGLGAYAAGTFFSATLAMYYIDLLQVMRVNTPTFTVNNHGDFRCQGGGQQLVPTAITLASVFEGFRVRIDATVSGATPGWGSLLEATTANAALIFDAEL